MEPTSFRILLCDDNPDDQALTRRFLRRACPVAEITAAGDGEEAVARLMEVAEGRAPVPHLVLLDFRMPKLRGDEVLRRVRCQNGLARVPFVLFCSDIVPHEVESCQEAGIDLFIQKPSEYENYEEAVRGIVARFVPSDCRSKAHLG
ncbi:response regulator [soil metagenome]